jgi:hypothetical protein
MVRPSSGCRRTPAAASALHLVRARVVNLQAVRTCRTIITTAQRYACGNFDSSARPAVRTGAGARAAEHRDALEAGQACGHLALWRRMPVSLTCFGVYPEAAGWPITSLKRIGVCDIRAQPLPRERRRGQRGAGRRPGATHHLRWCPHRCGASNDSRHHALRCLQTGYARVCKSARWSAVRVEWRGSEMHAGM